LSFAVQLLSSSGAALAKERLWGQALHLAVRLLCAGVAGLARSEAGCGGQSAKPDPVGYAPLGSPRWAGGEARDGLRRANGKV
jgi:hypothetical protein